MKRACKKLNKNTDEHNASSIRHLKNKFIRMKHIKIGVLILGICLSFSIGATGQTEVIIDSVTLENKSLVNVAYKTIDKKDLLNGVSVLIPDEYIDKNFGTYALENHLALIGGSNLWNIGNSLLLIDGVPRLISDVITSEIDQITYLKGANAAVLYGSYAANGIILITTKRGKVGERKSNVYVNTGINQVKSYPEYLGSGEYMTLYNQARLNDGLSVQYDSTTISNYSSGINKYRYPDVDYYSSEYLRQMYNTYNASADFSGGNERACFYALANIQNQNSLINFGEGVNEKSTRLSMRGNIDLNINKYIRTYVNMSNIFYDDRTANGNYWGQSTTIQPHHFSPLIPIDLISDEESLSLANTSRNIIDGKYLLGGNQQYLTNPISDVYAAGYNTMSTREFRYTSGLDIDLRNALKGLSFHGMAGIDYLNSYTQAINNTYAIYVPEWADGEISDSISGLSSYNKDSNTGTQNLSGNYSYQIIDFNMHLDYANTFNEKHNVSAMALASAFRVRQTGNYQYTTSANLGIQLAYNYKQKYYADFSGAIVNSTKLSEEMRVALSPTLSLGWLLSDEAFLNDSEHINKLKLVASAGIINTDMDIQNYYMYDAEFASTAYFSWADGTYISRATTASRGENNVLTYVKRKELSFGLDGTLFSNSIDFNTNVFFIKKDGLPVINNDLYPNFFRTGYPETSFVPYSNFEANAYKGFDFQLSYKIDLGELNFIVGASGTFVTTEALVRAEVYEDSYRLRAGNSTSALFGLESEGLFMDQTDIDNHAEQKFGEVSPGDIKYKDQNGDGIVDERDEVVIGDWMAPLTGGLHLTTQWKDFTLFILGTGNFGGTSMMNGDYYWVYGNRKYSSVVRDSWTEETKNTASYPRLTTLSGNNNFRTSDFWTYSTNRVNLSKVQLTYTFPKSILNIAAIKDVKIYASGSNLLTFSKNKDIMELNIGSMPQTRFYNFGIKAVF